MPTYPEEDKIFGGLPSFIADSMPDNWEHTVFNKWIKRIEAEIGERITNL